MNGKFREHKQAQRLRSLANAQLACIKPKDMQDLPHKAKVGK
jgi:hypothetical protein